MKRIIRCIYSVITLLITTCLLITVTVAWYTSNENVSTSGITGSIVDSKDILKSVNYYNFKVKKTNSNNQTELEIDAITTERINMKNYDMLSNEITMCMIEIELIENASYTNFNVVTRANSFIDQLVSTDNSLSSVISFYVPDNVVINEENKTITYDSISSEESFTTLDQSNQSYSLKDNKTLDLSYIKKYNNSIFLILDYNPEPIEYIYSKNIGNDVLNTQNNISYLCDFYFNID